ncbi:DUF2846 domain-containing protein [Variovorax rhizosphaerae]|uniref:DUF2846 domain-containing protein n=1 Tax=Variovorax rhizosphaerae TaxID=1836200 RepID=A0ABU8WZ74_9BURK
MRQWTIWLAVSVWALFLTGCGATGPRYSEVEKNLPSLDENQGRIVFLRDSAFGAAVQPEVRLNNQVVGKSQPNSFFFVDRPAGAYRASASTESESSINVTVKARTSSYVLMGMDMGLLVGRPSFQMLGESEAKGRLTSLAYGGSVPVTPGSAVTASASAASAPAAAATPAPTSEAAAIPQSARAQPASAAAASAAPAAPSDAQPFATTSMQDLRLLLPAGR